MFGDRYIVTTVASLRSASKRSPRTNVAVVATPAGGVPEIIQDGESGLLVPDGDASALAAALRRVLVDQTFRDRLVATGRAAVTERFAPGPAADFFLRIYQGVMNAH